MICTTYYARMIFFYKQYMHYRHNFYISSSNNHWNFISELLKMYGKFCLRISRHFIFALLYLIHVILQYNSFYFEHIDGSGTGVSNRHSI
jgi:hypothetical protein